MKCESICRTVCLSLVMIVFILFVVLQVSNWENDRSPTSQQEGLETARTWWRRCRVTSPVVTTGNWSAWISVFLMMGSHVALALSSHRSSVSTATVRGENSVCPSRSQDFTEWIWWFQNWVIHLIKSNIFFLQRRYLLIDSASKFLLAACSSLEWVVFLTHLHLQWRSAGLTLCEKSYIFQSHLSTDPPTLAVQLRTWEDFHDWTPGCHSSALWGVLSRLLSLESSSLAPPLSYFNACLVQLCHLSHSVPLITVFLSARTIKPYSH